MLKRLFFSSPFFSSLLFFFSSIFSSLFSYLFLFFSSLLFCYLFFLFSYLLSFPLCFLFVVNRFWDEQCSTIRVVLIFLWFVYISIACRPNRNVMRFYSIIRHLIIWHLTFWYFCILCCYPQLYMKLKHHILFEKLYTGTPSH